MTVYLFKVLFRLSIRLMSYLPAVIIIILFLFIFGQSEEAQVKIHSIPTGSAGKANLTEDTQNKFEYYSTESGLSSDLVLQILKDKYGFLWFATQSGLNKFNSYNFIAYENDPQDKNSISLNDISSLCELDGKIWAGTWGGGLNKFDRINKFTHYYNTPQNPTSISNNKIQFLFRDNNNTLWVCTTSGVDKYNPADNSFEHLLINKRIFKVRKIKRVIYSLLP